MEKKKVNTGTVVTIAVAVVALILAGVAIYATVGKAQATGPMTVKNSTVCTRETETPILPTATGDAYYTLSRDGTVSFFQLKDNSYESVSKTGSLPVSIKLGKQTLNTNVDYLKTEGGVSGAGLYRSDGSNGPYTFAAFYLANLPMNFLQENKCLLLVHTKQEQLYSESPLFEESYVLDLLTGKTERFISNKNRTFAADGIYRDDFAMLTIDEARFSGSQIPYFSGRTYGEADSAQKFDLYVKTPKVESVLVRGVLDKFSRETSDGILYLQAAEDGFAVMKKAGGANTAERSFKGDYYKEYVRNGDRLLSKTDGKIYSLTSNLVLDTEGCPFTPELFAVSPSGRCAAMVGMKDKKQYIWVYDAETKATILMESLPAEHMNLCFVGENALRFAAASASGGIDNRVISLVKES